LFVVSFYWL